MIFVAIVEAGGFGRAAEALGVSASQVSRGLKRLEARLGTRLMNRTTRRIALTDAGQGLLERVAPLLVDLEEAEEAVRDEGGEPRGLLRVSLPVTFGLRYVAPVATALSRAHPPLHVELVFSDRQIDLLDERFHVAVRLGRSADTSLIARNLGESRGLTVAAPAYLAARGTPSHPVDLTDHEVVLYQQAPGRGTWPFDGPDGTHAVPVQGRFASDQGDAVRQAAVAGLGIARLPDFLAAEDVRAGRLVRLLEPWERILPIAAVYPPGRHLSPKVRRFIDLLAVHLAEAPWQALCSDEGG